MLALAIVFSARPQKNKTVKWVNFILSNSKTASLLFVSYYLYTPVYLEYKIADIDPVYVENTTGFSTFALILYHLPDNIAPLFSIVNESLSVARLQAPVSRVVLTQVALYPVASGGTQTFASELQDPENLNG